MKTFGEQIRQKREQERLSQEEIARRAGINIRTLQRIEKGETSPYGATLRAINEALGLDMQPSSTTLEDRKISVLFELSALTFWVFPFGNLVAPYLMYTFLGQRLPGGENSWKSIKRFQLPWTVALWAFLVILIFFMMSNRPDMLLLMILVILSLVFVNTIVPIRRAYRSHKAMTQMI